jgi:hypothetical protein
MYSKVNIPDSVPLANYIDFDTDDGEEITGACSLGDYFVVFKRNKIGVITGDFVEFLTIAYGVGCVSHWSIVSLADKCIFLSEEGVKAFDGKNLYNYSKRINALGRAGYWSYNEYDRYTTIYYPQREQFQILMNTSNFEPMVLIGHLIVPLMYPQYEQIPEQYIMDAIAWTYHQYDYHTLTCLGTYTDTYGITKPIAADDDGYIYKLDTDSLDDTNPIEYKISTGWLTLTPDEIPTSTITKTLRKFQLSYVTNIEGTINIDIDSDFKVGVFNLVATGTIATYCGYCYCGYCWCNVDGTLSELFDTNACGKLFKFNISSSDEQQIYILKFVVHFRYEGVRT